MKAEKNHFFLKKTNFLFFKIFLWIGFGILFISFSFVVPSGSDHTIQELIVFMGLIIMVNIYTSVLYPIFSKKNKWLNMLILTIFILVCFLLEVFVFSEIFDVAFSVFMNKKRVYFAVFSSIIVRDLAFFIFFLWVENYGYLINLYKKQKEVHQEELSLLIEKQEFEKKFSRKKLLPHYFFNILEHIYAKFLDDTTDRDLLDKLKFILYYFLVDAEKEKVELEKELLFYKYYIELENFRHKNSISVNYNIKGDPEKCTIIPLLFEPVIGNALKYTKHNGEGWIDIEFDIICGTVIHFHCKNNYERYSSGIISSENGLKIFEQRLELCYKDNYILKILNENNIYEIILSIRFTE
jgi:sensor histidine kinase YesM